ncbi:MAG: hypothetical protein HY300_14940 [Verrucomicrobia bacterium]|nr:hypothetical protein [Verrucomicrobiota bacterium]
MLNTRRRPLLIAAAALAAVWIVALAGFTLARNAKVTAEKVRAYLRATDLKKLSGEARAKALRKLAEQMNALSAEERRRARIDREWSRWFDEMTEAEKSDFIEATLPSGFKQMLTAFEELDAAQRKMAVEGALRRLKLARENPELRAQWQADGSEPPPVQLSPELQHKITTIGLNAVYSQSSAQSSSMESGRLFR